MYLPAYFRQDRPEVLHAFMRAHPLATLIVAGADGLTANLVPMEAGAEPAPHGTLRAHVARANPLWRALAQGAAALAVFQGPQGYVSPGWYPSKAEHAKVVPTWNYALVQARGPVRVIEDAAWLRGQVERLTALHEGAGPQAWRVDDAPADFIDKMLAGIVGLEMTLTSLEGKFKASQNRPEPDRAGVLDGLRRRDATGDAELAEWMERIEGERG